MSNQLITEFIEKYGKRLNDEEKTLGDEIVMWMTQAIQSAEARGREKTIELTVKAMKKRYLRFDDSGEVDTKADKNEAFAFAFGGSDSVLVEEIEASLTPKVNKS